MKRECYVAVDFDGTVVTNKYPAIGDEVGAHVWLRAAVALGAKLILMTDRDNDTAGIGDGTTTMGDATAWFQRRHVEIWAVNMNPAQSAWTASDKLFAHAYIDKSCIGIPLRERIRGVPYVDWDIVGPLLLRRVAGVLHK